MSVWSKLFGSSGDAPNLAELAPPSRALPTTVDAIPGTLTVTFHAHDVADGSEGNFLTAVTEGLSKRRQRELVVSLRLAENDDVSERMRELSRFLRDRVALGAAAEPGRHRRRDALRQARHVRGQRQRLALRRCTADPRRRAAGRALAAILVDPAEVETALAHGVYRVLARIGDQSGCFPLPDLERSLTSQRRECT